MTAYSILNNCLKKYERSAALWSIMAVVLRRAPQYKREALNAAKNARLCHQENPNQLTEEDCSVLKQMVAELSR